MALANGLLHIAITEGLVAARRCAELLATDLPPLALPGADRPRPLVLRRHPAP